MTVRYVVILISKSKSLSEPLPTATFQLKGFLHCNSTHQKKQNNKKTDNAEQNECHTLYKH